MYAKCTQWFRHNGKWEYNHLEDGHAVTDKPIPKFPTQVGWTQSKWSRHHCWMRAGTVVWDIANEWKE